MREKNEIEKLLEEAEAILNENIEKETELLEKDSWANLDSKKYERAKIIFKKVLDLDPDSQQAQEGVINCEEMIQPYVPVQYMVPPPTTDDLKIIMIPLEDEDKPVMKLEKQKPWEIRRSTRVRDKQGLEYTGQQFGEASKKAKQEILEIIEEAKKDVESGLDPNEIYEETIKIIKNFQRNLHRGWKGHGPDILDFAKQSLKEALDLKKN